VIILYTSIMSFQRQRRRQKHTTMVQCPVPAGSTATLLTEKSEITIQSLAAEKLTADRFKTKTIEAKKVSATTVETPSVEAKAVRADVATVGKVVRPNGWSSGVVKDKMAYVKDDEIMMLLSFD
jgi:hypothetical protein